IELSRINRFAGTMILFWPFAWSLTMSALEFKIELFRYLQILAVGFAGAILLHSGGSMVIILTHSGGGCIWNDIVDCDLDAQVERTKVRPLPTGRITIPQALAFLAVHVGLIFWISQDLGSLAWWIVFSTVIPLAGLYPFMKRITYFPQIWLGVTLNAPILLPSAIFVSHISPSSKILALGGLTWTLWYDTIYACQDRQDDAKAGVKSITLLLDQRVKQGLGAFASVISFSWFMAGHLSGNGLFFLLVGAGGGSILLARDLLRTDVNNPKSCLRAFENNGFVIGPTVFVGFLADYLWKQRSMLQQLL
ncbi:4-hydroxybenzoate polyprenyl transferase, partial [Crepidotus variabilis]